MHLGDEEASGGASLDDSVVYVGTAIMESAERPPKKEKSDKNNAKGWYCDFRSDE